MRASAQLMGRLDDLLELLPCSAGIALRVELCRAVDMVKKALEFVTPKP